MHISGCTLNVNERHNLVPRAFLRRGEDHPPFPRRRKALETRWNERHQKSPLSLSVNNLLVTFSVRVRLNVSLG